MNIAKEKAGAIHWLPGKAGSVNPRSSWNPLLKSSTGTVRIRETQNRCRNICSCPVWSAWAIWCSACSWPSSWEACCSCPACISDILWEEFGITFEELSCWACSGGMVWPWCIICSWSIFIGRSSLLPSGDLFSIFLHLSSGFSRWIYS